MTSRETLAWATLAAPALTAAVICLTPQRLVTRAAVAGACGTAALALALAALALADPGETFADKQIAVDAAGGLLLAVIAVVGLASVLVSPAYLATVRTSLFSVARRQRTRCGKCRRFCCPPPSRARPQRPARGPTPPQRRLRRRGRGTAPKAAVHACAVRSRAERYPRSADRRRARRSRFEPAGALQSSGSTARYIAKTPPQVACPISTLPSAESS